MITISKANALGQTWCFGKTAPGLVPLNAYRLSKHVCAVKTTKPLVPAGGRVKTREQIQSRELQKITINLLITVKYNHSLRNV